MLWKLLPKTSRGSVLLLIFLSCVRAGTMINQEYSVTFNNQGRLKPLNARLRACLHEGGGPQVGELTRVTRLSI